MFQLHYHFLGEFYINFWHLFIVFNSQQKLAKFFLIFDNSWRYLFFTNVISTIWLQFLTCIFFFCKKCNIRKYLEYSVRKFKNINNYRLNSIFACRQFFEGKIIFLVLNACTIWCEFPALYALFANLKSPLFNLR